MTHRVLEERLKKLDHASCRRVLSTRKGIDFSSNDYLGFSQDLLLKQRIDDEFREVPIGASASRLLRGQLELFQKTEEVLAAFCSRESATLFPSGYQANVALLSSVLTPSDIVFSDQLNHASIIDGIRLSGAQRKIFPHSDIQALRKLLETHSPDFSLKVIVTESLFGMDGDIAPLRELADLAEEFSSLLIVDEAHATGLWGASTQAHGTQAHAPSAQGGGLVQSLGLSHRVFATVHPGGKAMGVGGAWICGNAFLKDYLVNFSRPVIFSTAPLPALAVSLRASALYWQEVGEARARTVLQRAATFKKALSLQFQTEVQGPILPIILGENSHALRSAQKLQEKGFDVRAIRPPTVPEGSARLRLTFQWSQTEEQLRLLAEDIRGIMI